MGYLVLLFTPFPGLQQMAVFSSVGLVAAYATVVCAYPVLLYPPRQRQDTLAIKIIQKWLSLWQVLQQRAGWQVGGLIVLVMIGGWGIWLLQPNDDIRLLNRPPQELLDAEKRSAWLLGAAARSRFLVVEGKTVQDVLVRTGVFCSSATEATAKKSPQRIYIALPAFSLRSSVREKIASSCKEAYFVLQSHWLSGCSRWALKPKRYLLHTNVWHYQTKRAIAAKVAESSCVDTASPLVDRANQSGLCLYSRA